MPTYSVQAPDGHTIDIEGPAGATHDQVVQMAQQLYKPGQIKAARAANQNGAITGMADLGSAGNAVQAGVLNFVHQIPLVGDAAMTAARGARDAAAGEGFDWGRANNEVHTILSSAQQTHPIASFVGGAAGAADTGVLGGAALKAAGIGVPSALALRAGQPVLNTARLAATGALVGGAQGAAQAGGEQAAAGNVDQIIPAAVAGGGQGAAWGAGIGAAGAPLTAVAKQFAPLGSKAALALSKVFGENAGDLQAAWNSFQQETGRAPTMAELANLKQQNMIAGVAKDSAPITLALRGASDAADQARMTNLRTALAPNAAGSGDFANFKDAQGDVDYPAARQFNFTIPTEDSAALGGVSPAEHLAGKALDLTGFNTADKVAIRDQLSQGRLSGEYAQLYEKRLKAAVSRGGDQSPAAETALGDLQSILGGNGPGGGSAVLDPANPYVGPNGQAKAALDLANANYAANANREAGAAHGESILGSDSAANFIANATSKANYNPDFAEGMHAGASSALQKAAATPQGATNLAERMGSDAELQGKLLHVYGPDAAAKMTQYGKRETAAADALAPYSNRLGPTGEQGPHPAAVAGEAALAAATHGAVSALHATRAAVKVANVRMSPAVQEKVAQYLTDPNMTEQGINILRRAGMSKDAIQRLAGAVGGLTGGAPSNSGH